MYLVEDIFVIWLSLKDFCAKQVSHYNTILSVTRYAIELVNIQISHLHLQGPGS